MSTSRTDGHPDIPDYQSVRVTCAHIDVRRMLEKIFSGLEYICYLHKGSKTKKEHCHVLVPTTDVTIPDKIRKRLTRDGYKGNETFSIKGFHNGLQAGIQYASKEGTKPIVNGDFDDIIASAPAWKQSTIDSHYNYHDDKQRLKVRSWQLTYTNIVLQAVHYARINRLTGTFKDVVQDMIHKTKWRPCHQMLKQGLPDFYHNDFEYQMGRKDKIDWSWMIPRDH